jgi:two-component system sensor histidine kinase CpxA
VKSLYAKILGWFLLTIAVSLGLFTMVARSAAERSVRQQEHPFMRTLALQADDARHAYETGGSARLGQYLARLRQFMGSEHYLVNAEGVDLVSGESRSELLANAKPPEARPIPSGDRIVITKSTTDGKYRLVVVGPPPLSPWTFAPYFVLVLAVVALLCWVLAITIASPLRRMATAVERFGSGDLGVRLGVQRKDEVGDLARAFDTMADRIQTLMTAERRLLQDVSHELRSPLARLSFAAELVKTAPDRNAAVARLQKEIGRLTDLVSALIQVTRAEGDPAARRTEQIDLSALVREIAEDCGIEAVVRHCRIGIESAAGVQIIGDPELVRRAIENVARNAVQYAPECSNIDVTVLRSGGYARVTVRDYGPGVPDDALDKIFNPFFRVDASRNSGTGGVGLGLAIASRALQLHHGTIAASNANPGLVITMDFPIPYRDRRDLGTSRDYNIAVEREQ